MEGVVTYNVPHFFSGFHTIPWPVLIAIYLFLGGISAGAFIASVIAGYIDQEKYKNISRVGAYVAPLPVIIGTGLLILDLDRPYRAFSLFWNIHPTSVMSLGAWLLLIFSILSVLYAAIFMAESGKLSAAQPLVSSKNIIGLAGLICAFGTAIYTGVLISAVISIRELWSQTVPVLFTISALSTGIASVIFFLALSPNKDRNAINRLGWADSILIAIELGIILVWIIGMYNGTAGNKEAIREIVGGTFGGMFWIGVVLIGLLIPLVMEYKHLKEARTHAEAGTGSALIAAVLVLVGGMILRYVVLIGGQILPLT
ncbi:MAG TPA: NrfD/PsrC family molybdoenzyme membrane anchor subunit [Thermodesulfobacteriota bacterium]|nr:NrfD/PsrC family molybdoenzyme membrane anchor subunit [Thermodesulfobacteriota bacterium]